MHIPVCAACVRCKARTVVAALQIHLIPLLATSSSRTSIVDTCNSLPMHTVPEIYTHGCPQEAVYEVLVRSCSVKVGVYVLHEARSPPNSRKHDFAFHRGSALNPSHRRPSSPRAIPPVAVTCQDGCGRCTCWGTVGVRSSDTVRKARLATRISLR